MAAQQEELDVTVLFDVFVLSRSVSRLLDDALDGTDLNGSDFAMTSMLRDQGAVTPARISAWTGMAPTTVSAVLARLVRRGFVVRHPHPDDGRSSLVQLTPDGRRATQRASRRFDASLADVHARLGAGLAPVRAHLQVLDDAVRGAAGTEPRPYRVPVVDEPEVSELTPSQAAEVRRYVDWVRARDGS